MDIVVMFKKGIPKGIMTEDQFEVCQSKRWWDHVEFITVPIDDWKSGKVKITNITNYL